MMNLSLLPHLQIHLRWTTWSRWQKKHTLNTPERLGATAHVIWLVKAGNMTIHEIDEKGESLRQWRLQPDSIIVWPHYLRRRVVFEENSEWYSMGLDAFLFGHINLGDSFEAPRELNLAEPQIALLNSCAQHLQMLKNGADALPLDTEPRPAPAEQQPLPRSLTPLEQLQVQSLAQVVFSLCWMVVDSKSPFPNALPDWLTSVLQLSEARPQLKVKDLAQQVGFSESQFRRLFVQWVGVPPHQYLHQHRLQRAQRLLETTDITCAEISHQLGFNSLSHFSQTFKSTLGITPARHRQVFLRSVQGDQ